MVNTWHRLKGKNNKAIFVGSGQTPLFKHLKELGQAVKVEYCPYCLCAQYEIIDGEERCLRCHKLKRR